MTVEKKRESGDVVGRREEEMRRVDGNVFFICDFLVGIRDGEINIRCKWRSEEGLKDSLTTSHMIESDENNPGVVMPVARDE
ncbi:hypothetical protein QJS10_CPB13g00366 [Acorus calamus]|uniref:Uncharacterized protein n=1 Tax=Acorus calamus TaxID=4465 RepID=A0AAV9DFS2_ACOCL|nr:hypothetical protein QJS10_CPB13g00366 [Acorus calamus]